MSPTQQAKQYVSIEISVAKAVRKSGQSVYYQLKSGENTIWVSMSDLLTSETKTIARISEKLGVPLLSNGSKSALKQIIEDVKEFEEGAVATQQGYLSPDIYIHANGDITKAASSRVTPIVAFDIDEYGGTKGTLRDWQKGITRSINENPYATFILCFGFLPLLLQSTPSYPLNPFLEIIGKRLSGKSTFAAMAASIYGGDPQSDVGYGYSWDTTPGAFPELKRRSADSLLFLDENNVQDASLRQNGKVAFTQSSTGDRKRMGDVSRKQAVRMALLSTGNKMPEKATSDNKDEIDAAASRVLTLIFDEPILGECSSHFATTKDAVRALRLHINECYGHPVRKFVKRVVEENEKDEKALSVEIQKLMKKFDDKNCQSSSVDDRLRDVIALTYATGKLAKRWKILPSGCSSPWHAAKAVLRMVEENQAILASPELNKIRGVLSRNADRIKTIGKKDKLAKKSETENLFACRVQEANDRSIYFVDSDLLRQELGAKSATILKKLRDDGVLIGEAGKNPKLQSHAPAYVPFKGRLYKLIIPDQDT